MLKAKQNNKFVDKLVILQTIVSLLPSVKMLLNLLGPHFYNENVLSRSHILSARLRKNLIEWFLIVIWQAPLIHWQKMLFFSILFISYIINY